MRHNQDSHYWTPERRRQEFRDAILAAVLLVFVIIAAVLWMRGQDVHQVHRAPPVCQMNSNTTGFCDD